MKFFFLIGIVLVCTNPFISQAQTTELNGIVTDQKKNPLAGVNVFLKGTYDGATTDAKGQYRFTTSDTGTLELVATLLGFKDFRKTLILQGGNQQHNFMMKEKVNELKAVTISAGTIEASDSRRVTVLKPLDIVTTANAQGDIFGALRTLPGAQQVGEQEGLFVRGGAGSETKTIIDGMVVNNPFFSSTPDIAQRGRFNPFLFKGTVFSTGGYSAQYGQALSSALVLETQDMPDRTASTYSISAVGLGGGHVHLSKDKKSAWGGDLNYTNLLPYMKLVPQRQTYQQYPEFFGGSAFYRHQLRKNGLLKFYGYYNYGRLGLSQPRLDSLPANFRLNNHNVYTNLTYKDIISDKWSIYGGISYSYNLDNIRPDSLILGNRNELLQTRIMVTRVTGDLSALRVGGEWQQYGDGRSFQIDLNGFSTPKLFQNLQDYLSSAFAEYDLYANNRLVFRFGGRYEYSSILAQANLAPRVSISYKAGANSTLGLAYGDFYQKPVTQWLYDTRSHQGFEKATHYILNYQWITPAYTFRVEAYRKQYDQLLRTFEPNWDLAGGGYAQGIDLFWRDRKTFKNVDYWISYSFLDTRRQYLNYPIQAMPTFATPHTATLVFKKFFTKLNTAAGFTYSYSTGRPYFNPYETGFLTGRTPDLHNFGVNASILKTIRGAFCVLALSVTNVLGLEQVFTYRFNAAGERIAVGPPAPRFFFVGLFISVGQNRSNEVVNQNN